MGLRTTRDSPLFVLTSLPGLAFLRSAAEMKPN